MKIAFYEINDWEKAIVKKKLKGHELVFFKDPLNPATLKGKENYDAVSVFIYSRINKDVLSRLPKLELIATRSTGFDHIDTVACSKRKVKVSNVPYYGENTVAEHTFALILALSRNVHKAHVKRLRNDYSLDGLKGFDLSGKTIGVIGAGNIGLHVIRIAKGFGMEVLATDINQNNFLAEVLDFKYVPLDDLLGHSDIVSIHTPYNDSTHHLINRSKLKKIKKGAILINTARGAIVETDALIESLDNKALAGAGLDVLEGEKLIREEREMVYEKKNAEDLAKLTTGHILLEKDNVVFTPHIAFYSQEALLRILNTTISNISGYFAKDQQNII